MVLSMAMVYNTCTNTRITLESGCKKLVLLPQGLNFRQYNVGNWCSYQSNCPYRALDSQPNA